MRTKQFSPNAEQFRENSSEYRCCCRCLHVKTGAAILAYLGIFGGLVQLLSLLFNSGSASGVATVIASVAIGIGASFCLLYATITEEKAFVLPYIVLGVVGLLTIVISAILFFIGALFPESFIRDIIVHLFSGQYNIKDTSAETLRVLCISAFFTNIFVMAFSAWLLSVVFKYYRYLSDKYIPVLVSA